MLEVKDYETLIFDCDGVILNSNFIKAQCFQNTIQRFGDNAVKEFMEYNSYSSGISRNEKFEYFLKTILPKYKNIKFNEEECLYLIEEFTKRLKICLVNCELSKYIKELRESNINQKWLVVSGSDHDELQEIFKKKGIFDIFDGGIFGSFDTKTNIIKNQLSRSNIKKPALFIGDSKLDFTTSKNLNIDFIFISDWTELPNWEYFCKANEILNFPNLSYLIQN